MYKVVASYAKNQSKQTAILGILVALLVLAMVLAQLFGFEDLPGILAHFWGMDEGLALAVGALLVTMEVFSLPVFLGMKLSSLMRKCSAIAGGLVVGYWMGASFYAISLSLARDSGMFGGKLETLSSLLLPVVSALLIALLWVYWVSALRLKLPGRNKSNRKG
ncbi:MAG TPA: hypothetical protein VGE13_03430 [Candidatus Saccharimonadales bacterium]